MAANEKLASILVKNGLNSIFTNSPIGYFSKFANDSSRHLGGAISHSTNSIAEIKSFYYCAVPNFFTF